MDNVASASDKSNWLAQPPTFPVADSWYSLSEIRNLIAKPVAVQASPELLAKKKTQLTCDLTFRDVLDNRNNLTFGVMLDMAHVLGYKYFVWGNKVYEVKWEIGEDITIAPSHRAENTGLTLEDINEIL